MDLLRVSNKIRQIRQSHGMTVEQLAQKCGFSKGFISQVENFRITPSLKALNKLSEALGIEISELFSTEEGSPEFTFGTLEQGEPVNRDDGRSYGIEYHALAYRQTERRMEPFLIEYHASDEEREFKMHDTEEFFVLLEGEIDFCILNEKPHRMCSGDTLYMKANLPHKVRLAGSCAYAKALAVYSAKA